MICNATYNAYDEIPEALRGEFEQVGDKWQLKESAIPGVGPLFNSAVAANAARAVEQVKLRNGKIRELESKITDLESKVTLSEGQTVLSDEEQKLFSNLKQFGDAQAIQAAFNELTELRTKLKDVELTSSIEQVAKSANLNGDVLLDWAKQNPGLKFLTKDVETVDAKGTKTVAKQPVVQLEIEHNGKQKIEEHSLIDYAKSNMPEWKFNAMQATKQNSVTVQSDSVRLPALGSAAAPTSIEPNNTRPVDKFNAARAAAPSPFAPAAKQGV